MKVFRSLINKLKETAEILKKAEGQLDENEVSYLTINGRQNIKTNAYRQIERFQRYYLSKRQFKVPHKSKNYQAKKRSLGMPADFWTLVYTGILYRTLRYKVKGGALYVEYDDSREIVANHLKRLSGLDDLLQVTEKEAKEMAKVYYRSVVQKALQVWLRKG